MESSEAASYVRCRHTNKTSLAISSHEFIWVFHKIKFRNFGNFLLWPLLEVKEF